MGFSGVPTLDEVLRGSNNKTIEQLKVGSSTYDPLISAYNHPTTEDSSTLIFEIDRPNTQVGVRRLVVGGVDFNTNNTNAMTVRDFNGIRALQVDTVTPAVKTVATVALIDATYNLGGPSNRYKDLYLSGGVISGGSGDFITLNIFDPTKIENAVLSRSITTLTVDAGIGGDTIEFAVGGITHMEMNSLVLTLDLDIIPDADGVRNVGANGSRFLEGFINEFYTEAVVFQDPSRGDGCIVTYDATDWAFEAEETLGVTRKVVWNMPVGVGGAAAAPLHYQFTIDGSLEFGLVAETDGAGSYREPVAIIPYVTGAYGAAWGAPPNPTPQGLQNGGMFVAWNTDGGGKSALFVYANGAWRRIDNDL